MNTVPVQDVCMMEKAKNQNCADKEKMYYTDFLCLNHTIHYHE